MLNFQHSLTSEKLTLRPLVLSDFEAMRQLTQEPDMWYYFTADLSDRAVLRRWIEEAVAEHAQHKSLPFAIVHKPDNQLIGSTRIGNISAHNQRVEIGWTWIAKPFQGTGVNQHAKKMLFEYLFTHTTTQRIELKTDVLNAAARKAMEKVGLVEEGVLRSHTLMTNNRRRDTVYYSILKHEWERKIRHGNK